MANMTDAPPISPPTDKAPASPANSRPRRFQNRKPPIAAAAASSNQTNTAAAFWSGEYRTTGASIRASAQSMISAVPMAMPLAPSMKFTAFAITNIQSAASPAAASQGKPSR